MFSLDMFSIVGYDKAIKEFVEYGSYESSEIAEEEAKKLLKKDEFKNIELSVYYNWNKQDEILVW